MLRLTPRRKRRVPNTLAILGVLLLAASVFVEGGSAIPSATQQASTLAAESTARFEPQGEVREPTVIKARKFRVNLFLFRH